MWDCPVCGCQSIISGLGVCPQCFSPRPEEESVPAEGGQPVASDGGGSTSPDPASPQAPESMDWGLPDGKDQ